MKKNIMENEASIDKIILTLANNILELKGNDLPLSIQKSLKELEIAIQESGTMNEIIERNPKLKDLLKRIPQNNNHKPPNLDVFTQMKLPVIKQKNAFPDFRQIKNIETFNTLYVEFTTENPNSKCSTIKKITELLEEIVLQQSVKYIDLSKVGEIHKLVGVNEQLAKNDMIKEILVALNTISYENQT